MKKISTLLCVLMNGSVYASSIEQLFQTDLSPQDVQVVKSFAQTRPLFTEYMYSPQELDVVKEVKNIEDTPKTNKVGKVSYGASCGISLANYFFKKNQLNAVLDSTGDDCYITASVYEKHAFSHDEVFKYRQSINLETILDNTPSCLVSQGCSLDGMNQVVPKNLSSFYYGLVAASSKCQSDKCKIDIALVDIANKDLDQKILALNANYPDIKPKYTDAAILKTTSSAVQKASSNKWDLTSAILGQITAYRCNQSILQAGKDVNDNSLDSCFRVQAVGLVVSLGHQLYPGQQARYSEGLHDGTAIIKSMKPNQRQTQLMIDSVNKELQHLAAMGDTQGFND
jgi:hypothetical protein